MDMDDGVTAATLPSSYSVVQPCYVHITNFPRERLAALALITRFEFLTRQSAINRPLLARFKTMCVYKNCCTSGNPPGPAVEHGVRHKPRRQGGGTPSHFSIGGYRFARKVATLAKAGRG